MVIIQPFEYEKTTAFKERVQIANKVNEIIDLFNELDIESKINIFNEEIEIINGKIAEIDSKIVEVDNAVAVVEGYNTRLTSVENESVSLDARLDNLEPRVTANETLSSNNKTRLDNLTPRVTATENKNTEQDTRLTNIDNKITKINDDFMNHGVVYSKKVLCNANKYTRLCTLINPATQNQVYLHIMSDANDIRDNWLYCKSNGNTLLVYKNYSINSQSFYYIETTNGKEIYVRIGSTFMLNVYIMQASYPARIIFDDSVYSVDSIEEIDGYISTGTTSKRTESD